MPISSLPIKTWPTCQFTASFQGMHWLHFTCGQVFLFAEFIKHEMILLEMSCGLSLNRPIILILKFCVFSRFHAKFFRYKNKCIVLGANSLLQDKATFTNSLFSFPDI